MVVVERLKRRGPPKPARRDPKLSLSDVLDRLDHLQSTATKVGSVEDKLDLIRAIGSLKADLRRRGVE